LPLPQTASVAIADGSNLTLSNIVSGRVLGQFVGEAELARPLIFSPDGELLAFRQGSQVIVLGMKTMSRMATLAVPADEHGFFSLGPMAFCPGTQDLVTAGAQDGLVRVFKAPQYQNIRTLQGHLRRVDSMAISPDGAILATGSEDSTVRLWNTHTWQAGQRDQLRGDGGPVRALAFAPDGKTLAVGDYDGEIRLWIISTRREAGRFRAHTALSGRSLSLPTAATLLPRAATARSVFGTPQRSRKSSFRMQCRRSPV
jgi:WD40 repeat protein